MRKGRLLLAILAVPALLAGGAWYGLLHTEAGARWLWAQAERATGGAMAAQDLVGDLASGLSITRFSFATDAVHVSAAQLAIDVNVDLMTDPGRQPFRIDQLQLPFVLAIARLHLDEASVVSDAGETIAEVDSATLAARWADAIAITDLDVLMPGIGAAGNARLHLREPYDLAVGLQARVEPELTGLRDTLPLQLAAEGPLDDFAVDARSDAPRATLSGRVADITRSIRWDLALEIPAATLPAEQGLADVPPLRVIAEASGGTRDFTVDANLSLAGTNSTATLSADVDIEAGTLEGGVDWQNAQWPPADPDPRVASRRGKLAVSGSLDAWRIDGTVQLSVPDLPAGQFKVRGGGDLDGCRPGHLSVGRTADLVHEPRSR